MLGRDGVGTFMMISMVQDDHRFVQLFLVQQISILAKLLKKYCGVGVYYVLGNKSCDLYNFVTQ